MRGLRVALGLAFVAWLSVPVVAGAGNPLGSGGGVVAPAPAPVLDAATRAKIEELYKKLDELTTSGVRGGNWGGYGVSQGGNKDYQDAYNQIMALSVGPDLVNKNDEYQVNLSDLQKQQMEVWQDKNLDAAAKSQKAQEIYKRITALNAQYSVVVARRTAAQNQISQRSMRRYSLTQLKKFLGVSDDDWKGLEPRLDEVLRLQTELRNAKGTPGFGFMMIPSQKWQNPPKDTPDGDLIAVLKGDNADAKDVKPKLDAVRKAKTDDETKRTALVADLTKQLKEAQDKLRELLSVKQEAMLVVEGILD